MIASNDRRDEGGVAVLLARETIALRNSEERRRASSSAASELSEHNKMRRDMCVPVVTPLHAAGTRAIMSMMEGKLGGAAACAMVVAETENSLKNAVELMGGELDGIG